MTYKVTLIKKIDRPGDDRGDLIIFRRDVCGIWGEISRSKTYIVRPGSASMRRVESLTGGKFPYFPNTIQL